MNKIDFLEQIEVKVKDIAGEFIKIANTTGPGSSLNDVTLFPVDNVIGFEIGDTIYLNDKNGNAVFSKVLEVPAPESMTVSGNHSSFPKGTQIKKTDAIKYLDEAFAIYSRYRPMERSEPITFSRPGNIFNLSSDWENGFSKINFIEYPVGQNPPVVLNEKDYEVFLDDGNTYKLRFNYTIYVSFILNFMVSHSFDGSNPPVSKIPHSDFYCVCNIAAGFYLLALANRYGESVNPTIGTEAIKYDDKTDKYKKMAANLFLQSASWLGVNISGKEGFIFEQLPFSSDQSAGGGELQERLLSHNP